MGPAAGATGADAGVEASAMEQGPAVAARLATIGFGVEDWKCFTIEWLSWRAGPARRVLVAIIVIYDIIKIIGLLFQLYHIIAIIFHYITDQKKL